MILLLVILSVFTFTATAEDWPPGAERTSIEEHPYHAQILRADLGYECGATIVSENFVLTHSECSGPAFVRVGTDRKYDGDRVHAVASFVRHNESDLMLVRVQKPFHFDKVCKPVNLANRELDDSPIGWIIGYGGGSHLRKSMVPYVDRDTCAETVKQEWHEELKNGTICGGYHGFGGIGPCQGDLGGALLVDGWITGMISRGDICFEPYSLGFFTDVFYHRDWILKIINAPISKP